jgi:hypothetical protein
LRPRRNSRFEGIDDLMPQDERVSYVMLFCALMLVRNTRATVQQSMEIVPLNGGAKRLAGEITSQD